jgi:hypothetical protein
MVYTGTSKHRWISWTSPHWEFLIDMQSKLSRNSSNRVSGRSMDRERKANLKRASPKSRKRRVMGSLRKTLESGVSSTTSLGTTLMNVTQYNDWWLSSKTKIRTPTWTLIHKIIKGDRSLMHNPLLLLHLQKFNQKRILRRGSDPSIHRCG